MKDLARTAAALLFAVLAGCGGGGGGGGAASGSSDTPLSYVGNTNAAAVTTANASAITAFVLTGGQTSQAISSLAAPPAAGQDVGMVDLGRQLHRSVRNSVRQVGRTRSRADATSAVDINEIEPCDSGSVHFFGTLNDDGTGAVSIQYNACQTGSTVVSGSGTLTIHTFFFGFGPVDYTVAFTRLTVTGSATGQFSGTLRVQIDPVARKETTTENAVVLFISGTMGKSENFVSVNVYDNISNPTSYTESQSGRVFHSVHGYVDVSTIVPFIFMPVTEEFPQNGQLLLTGANGASILVTALSPTAVRLSLDIDSVTGFERVVTLSWSDLAGPVGANLADSDGDGMHDSWELAFGLDPNNAADASLDSDGDGASNLSEYQSGTRPNSAGSIPPSVGLSIAARDLGDPVAVGENLVYVIDVSNSSPNPANDVVLVDKLPAGVNLVFARPLSQGTCNGATPTLTCNLGRMNAFSSVQLEITISPTAPGLLTNVATVTSSSFDAVVTDNTTTTVSTAGRSLFQVQALINAAAEGDTVFLDPGLYVGSLSLRRNVHLRSSKGPATTIIQATNGNTAISIGPSGSIHGFTFTAGQALGRAIDVTGAGSVISGNVFDGIAGPAISGLDASPRIEGNVFRNISCPDQFVTGVVVFGIMSSPRIINNLFVNNTCRGIDLTLPQFNAPEVINNTFVGNRVAILVDRRVPQVTQTYRNNIIVNNGVGLEIATALGSDADNPVWTNNLVFGNSTDYSGTANLNGSNGNISADPLFVDRDRGNYDLQEGSPAIDRGSTLGAPTVDFENQPRLRVVDIGAFEGP